MLRIACVPIFIFSLSSCAGLPAVQGRVRNLAAKGDFEYAAQVVSRLKNGSYGKNNRLLEALDRGMIFHYAGQYEKSIQAFEEAKRIYEDLYTESVSKIAASWLWNDATLPYTGEDFERAMVNVIQALNFIMLEKYDAALVEARNASMVLQVLNDRYSDGPKNVYDDDAFVRLLMGIIYECLGERQNLNDAFISYRKALDVYEGRFQKNYSVEPPKLLKENLLSVAGWMGDGDAKEYGKRFSQISVYSLDDRQKNAEVYIIHFRGQIINKVQGTIVLPGMDGLLTRISFPRYRRSFRTERPFFAYAVDQNDQKTTIALERAHDLDVVARKNLEDRRARILIKAVARPLTKQLLIEAMEDHVSKTAGHDAAEIFRYAGNLYLLYSEDADLRSWETLPSEIYIGRAILKPGDYKIFIDKTNFKELFLRAGNKKFIIHWSGY